MGLTALESGCPVVGRGTWSLAFCWKHSQQGQAGNRESSLQPSCSELGNTFPPHPSGPRPLNPPVSRPTMGPLLSYTPVVLGTLPKDDSQHSTLALGPGVPAPPLISSTGTSPASVCRLSAPPSTSAWEDSHSLSISCKVPSTKRAPRTSRPILTLTRLMPLGLHGIQFRSLIC